MSGNAAVRAIIMRAEPTDAVMNLKEEASMFCPHAQ